MTVPVPAWVKLDLIPPVVTVLTVLCGGAYQYASLQANDRMYAQQIGEMKIANAEALAALRLEGQRRNDRLDVVLDRFAGQIQDDTNRITRVEAQIATIPWVRK